MRIIEKLTNGQPVKIVFLGDSITQGCFEGDPAPDDEQYIYHSRFVSMLQEQYPNAKIDKINAGISGNTAGMGLYRLKKDVLDKRPDLCVVCFGLNDTSFGALNRLTMLLPMARKILSTMRPQMDPVAFDLLKKQKAKDAYEYSINEILHQLKVAGIKTIVLLPNRFCIWPVDDKKSPLYLLSVINAKLVNSGKMDMMMEAARGIARQNHVQIADGYERWKQLEREGVVSKASFANGTNHPSRELHQVLADVLFAALER